MAGDVILYRVSYFQISISSTMILYTEKLMAGLWVALLALLRLMIDE